MDKSTVSLLTEVPETLHDQLKAFLESHPDWTQDRAFQSALSLFLLNSGINRAAPAYLDSLFK